VSEITTAEHFLLVRYFEIEGEMEAMQARLAEVEQAYNDLASLIREGPGPNENLGDFFDRLEQMVEHGWETLYAMKEEA
jgi:predicted nuclease with TOPRIM domain